MDHNIDSLDDVQAEIESRLIDGGKSRRSPMHTPVVGTADGDLRVMVLREFDPDTRTLRFHTDARSPKVAAINANSAVSVLAYDAAAKVQIRMRGTGKVEHMTPLADAKWAESTTFARRCYLAEAGPSSTADGPTSGLPEWAEGLQPTEEQVAPARENFAVVLIEVAEFDWLYLSNNGHRRARISINDGAAAPKMEWLTP